MKKIACSGGDLHQWRWGVEAHIWHKVSEQIKNSFAGELKLRKNTLKTTTTNPEKIDEILLLVVVCCSLSNCQMGVSKNDNIKSATSRNYSFLSQCSKNTLKRQKLYKETRFQDNILNSSSEHNKRSSTSSCEMISCEIPEILDSDQFW